MLQNIIILSFIFVNVCLISTADHCSEKKSPDLSGFAVRDAKLQEALDTKKPFVGFIMLAGK